MKLSYLILIGMGIAIGYLLATGNTDEIVDDLKEGFSKGKDLIKNKLKQTASKLSDDLNGGTGQ